MKFRFVVQPQFDLLKAYDFSEGMALVGTDDGYGYIDKQGNFSIKPQFEYARSFSEGLACIGFGKNEFRAQHGYIDKTGKMVIAAQSFMHAYDFHEGLAHVVKGFFNGYLDITGNLAIEPNFAYVEDFSAEGLAKVNPSIYDKGIYIDKTGKIAIKLEISELNYSFKFSEGMAFLQIRDKYGCGFINTKGEMVIKPQFESADRLFSNGLTYVKIGGKYGYIDTTGKIVIDPIFDEACSFSDGLACVKFNHRYGFINKTGEIVIDSKFDYISYFSEGVAHMQFGYEKYGYINKRGDIVIAPQFNSACAFKEGIARVEINRKYGYISQL